MTSLGRKLSLIAAALVALIVATTAGAIVRDTIITIPPDQYAKLAGTGVSGTGVYCVNSPKDQGFVCAVWRGNHPISNTYGVLVARSGVVVQRTLKNGKAGSFVAEFSNR